MTTIPAPLLDSDRWIQTVAETTTAGIFVYRDRLLYANRALADLTGYPVEQLLALSATEALVVELGRVREKIDRAADKGSPVRIEIEITRRDGEHRWLEVSATRVLLSDGPAIVGTSIDVTDRRRAERAVRESESWFRALAENSSIAIFVTRRRIHYANRAAAQLTGYSLEELMGLDALDLVHPDHREETIARLTARMAGTEHPEHYEFVLLTRDGEERWVDISSASIQFQEQRASLACVFDVTDRKRAELALRQSEERLQMAQRSAGVITWEWNLLTDEILLADPSLADLGLGLGDRRLPASSVEFLERMLHPDDIERVRRAAVRTIKGEGDYEVEHRIVLPGGSMRWFAQRGRAIRDESGWVVRMIGVAIDITERKETELALAQSEERLRLTVQQMPAILWTTGLDLRLTSSTGSGLAALGLTAEDTLDATLPEFFGTSSGSEAVRAHQKALAGESVGFLHRWMARTFQVYVQPLADPAGETVGAVGIALDVTDRERAEDALFQEQERAQATLASIGDGVLRTDADGAINYMNPVAEELTGVPASDAVGRQLEEVYRVIDETSGSSLMTPVERCLRENRPVILPGQRLLISRTGAEYAIRDSAAPLRGRGGEALGAVLAFKDITAVRDMEREMTYLASHDGITGLLNRAEFERRLERALAAVENERRPSALIYLDLAQLKVINDTCGHLAGDETLKQVARLLEAEVRENDALARVGGDEFGILLCDCPFSEARRRAEQVRDRFASFRFSWFNRSFEIGVSIGMVEVVTGLSPSRLMIAADTACRLARESGRNRIHLYRADDEALAERYGEMHWIHRIRRALDEESFRLYCQPIVPLRRGDPEELMCEILVRMVDDDGNLIMPESFVPTAERYRLISQVDRWVVKNSFRALAEWASLGGRRVTHLAINISGESLNDDTFLDYVGKALEASAVEPSRVLFEITETAAIANLAGAMRFISDLQERGCRFVLDDFGSGLSSFAYLKNLPVDCLKISREFVRGITQAGVQRTLVRSINQIGHDLGLFTIAEGIEDENTLRIISELKLDYAQGNWLGAPGPLDER